MPVSLEDWVMTLEQRGHPRKDIRTTLLRKGFSPQEVNRALTGELVEKKSSLASTLTLMAVLVFILIMIPVFMEWLLTKM